MQSLAHQFLTFCREKPADEGYEFDSTDNCAFCQFLRETGIAANPCVDYDRWRDRYSSHSHRLPDQLIGTTADSKYAEECGVSPIGALPHTFGALADRLSAALGESL